MLDPFSHRKILNKGVPGRAMMGALARPRAGGALTDKEFEREKKKLSGGS